MRSRALLTLVLGVTVASSAVAYLNVFMKSPVSQQVMRDVVIIAEDVPFGHVVDEAMLAVRSWPVDALPEGVFASIDEVTGGDATKSRRAKYNLAGGDLLISSKVSELGEQVSITQQIDPAMRAVTIRVNDVTGVAGFVAPSDRIDLTLTRNVEQNLITSTILQDVEVLGIDQSANTRSEPGKIRTVTVQVDPSDAQKLALAQQAGTLSVSLRHIDAADRPALKSISVNDLTEPTAPAVVKKRSSLPSIVVNRGGERSTVEVPSG